MSAESQAKDTQSQQQQPQSQPQPQPQAPSSNLRDLVQSQVVELITDGLEEGTISEDRARSIAQMVLEKLPEGISDKELMSVLPTLDDEFRELSDVVLPIVLDYEKKITTVIEDKVLKLVRAKKFKDALQLARKGIEYTRKLN